MEWQRRTMSARNRAAAACLIPYSMMKFRPGQLRRLRSNSRKPCFCSLVIQRVSRAVQVWGLALLSRLGVTVTVALADGWPLQHVPRVCSITSCYCESWECLRSHVSDALECGRHSHDLSFSQLEAFTGDFTSPCQQLVMIQRDCTSPC